jgi:hypothetical protein
MAETALGAVRVHCGTWRWQCGASATSTRHSEEPDVPTAGRIALEAAGDRELAA